MMTIDRKFLVHYIYTQHSSQQSIEHNHEATEVQRQALWKRAKAHDSKPSLHTSHIHHKVKTVEATS